MKVISCKILVGVGQVLVDMAATYSFLNFGDAHGDTCD